MIGNSQKSDVLPVLAIGGHAIHLPYHITWAHETIDAKIDHINFEKATHWGEVLDLVSRL